MLGKPVGSDEKSGKMTYPALLGMQAAKERAEDEISTARVELARLEEIYGLDVRFFEDLTAFILKRAY